MNQCEYVSPVDGLRCHYTDEPYDAHLIADPDEPGNADYFNEDGTPRLFSPRGGTEHDTPPPS